MRRRPPSSRPGRPTCAASPRADAVISHRLESGGHRRVDIVYWRLTLTAAWRAWRPPGRGDGGRARGRRALAGAAAPAGFEAAHESNGSAHLRAATCGACSGAYQSTGLALSVSINAESPPITATSGSRLPGGVSRHRGDSATPALGQRSHQPLPPRSAGFPPAMPHGHHAPRIIRHLPSAHRPSCHPPPRATNAARAPFFPCQSTATPVLCQAMPHPQPYNAPAAIIIIIADNHHNRFYRSVIIRCRESSLSFNPVR